MLQSQVIELTWDDIKSSHGMTLSHIVIIMSCVCVLQSQVIEFAWEDVLQFEVDNDQMTFNFEYRREGRKPRWIRIFTPYVSALLTSVSTWLSLC